MSAVLQRTMLRTSRLLDFASEKELIAQAGHRPEQWPLVVLKELVDNAIDAAEEANMAPVVEIAVDGGSITVADNGPGLPADVVPHILDFSVRVSSREAYVSPTRGAQGIPDDATLADAYRRMRKQALVQQRIDEVLVEMDGEDTITFEVPDDLRARIAAAHTTMRFSRWDSIVAQIAKRDHEVVRP